MAERAALYGDPRIVFDEVAAMWSAILTLRLGRSVTLTGDLVAVLMASLKLARLAVESGREHRDSYVDAGNYLRIAEDLVFG